MIFLIWLVTFFGYLRRDVSFLVLILINFALLALVCLFERKHKANDDEESPT